MKIVLDAIEEKVKSLLLQYSREFAKSGNPDVTLRFTGGWVRDKILGRPSHDIDVAIDKSTGEDFATGLHNYMVDMGIEETGVHKIAVNPEKSKHLETATTRICGLDIDFVNLRSEEYASTDSRVPSSVKFGTPEEDAFRRDATLNALFYNITTDVIEDFTGRGLQDLHDGVLRTPLDPKTTFDDDPLRVLRLLRFVGQLGFTIAPETLEAMTGPQIGPKLVHKVSSERTGTELLKLLESPHAFSGLKYLLDLDLGPYIFRVPETQVRASTAALQKRYASVVSTSSALASLGTPASNTEQAMLLLSSLLQDLHDDDRTHNYVAEIIQNGLKLTRQAKDGCLRLVNSASPFDALRAGLYNGTAKRSDYGLYVRQVGDLWKLSLAFNAARLNAENLPVDDALKINDAIIDAKLEKAHQLKPALDGKAIMKLTNRKPGAWLTGTLSDLIKFQLDHPDASTEEIQQHILENLEEQ